MRHRRAHFLLAAFVAVGSACLIWPGAMLGARIEPYVLGLPFSLAFVAAWPIATFVVLSVYDRRTGGRA